MVNLTSRRGADKRSEFLTYPLRIINVILSGFLTPFDDSSIIRSRTYLAPSLDFQVPPLHAADKHNSNHRTICVFKICSSFIYNVLKRRCFPILGNHSSSRNIKCHYKGEVLGVLQYSLYWNTNL